MKASYLSPLVLTLGLAACGGDDGGVAPVVDAARAIDAAPPQIDAPPPAQFLVGTLSNVTFEHVTLAQGMSTPAGDGCVTKIDNATFDAEIMPASGKPGQEMPARVKIRMRSVDVAPGGPACTVSSAMFGDRGALANAQALLDSGQDPADPGDDVLNLLAPLEAAAPSDILDLQLWAGFGVFANGFAPGAYPISGDELQFATCGVCTFVHTNVSQQAPMGDGDYLATGGTVTITTVGPR